MSLGNIGNYINENWHGGQIEGEFFDYPEFDIEENVQIEKKSNKSVWNWKYAITRELMRGKHKQEILSKYKVVIERFGIQDVVNKFLDKNDGVLGYFIVDVSNFDDKFTYNDIPQQLKDCNLYAINAIELREIINRSLVNENDGSLDGFLNSNENVDEEVYYIDECTGLPVIDEWNGESDDEDERLNSIANLFLGKKWMTLSEKEKFDTIEGKFPYLISIVKRAHSFNSKVNDKINDDVNDFQIKNQELQADSQEFLENVEVNNIHERKMDDIGDVSLLKKIDVINKLNKTDFCDDFEVDEEFQSYDIKDEINKYDSCNDVAYDKQIKQEKIDNLKEFQFDDVAYDKQIKQENIDNLEEMEFTDINTEITDYGFFNDNMHEESSKDYETDVQFDNFQDFIIEDIKDMKDDQFDYADLSNSDVDIDEMFEDQMIEEQVQYEKPIQKIEISNKYDWSW